MTKALIIDFELLNELSINVNSFLFLYNLHQEKIIFDLIMTDNDEKYLEEKKLIKVNNGICQLRQESINLIELLTIESSSSIKNNKTIKKSSRVINKDVERITEFRELWKGLKPGSMGSEQACEDKMKRWIRDNPEYTFDEIIKAAKLYLSTEGMNTRFLQRADYFIYKQTNNREEESRLSAYIDEIGDGEIISDGWTSKLN